MTIALSMPSSSQHRGERALVLVGRRRRDHVDRIRDRRRRRAGATAQRVPTSRRQRRQLEALRLAGVGGEDARTAGVGQHRDAAPARHRLLRQHAS